MFRYVIKQLGSDTWEWCGSGLKEAKENLLKIRKENPSGIFRIYKWDSKKGSYV